VRRGAFVVALAIVMLGWRVGWAQQPNSAAPNTVLVPPNSVTASAQTDPVRCFGGALRDEQDALQAYQVILGSNWQTDFACRGAVAAPELDPCWALVMQARPLIEQAAGDYENARKTMEPTSSQLVHQGNALIQQAAGIWQQASACFAPILAQWTKNGGRYVAVSQENACAAAPAQTDANNQNPYICGFLQGVASCLQGIVVSPIQAMQQLGTHAGYYWSIAEALSRGDMSAAKSVLDLKTQEDVQNFDAYAKSLPKYVSLSKNAPGPDPNAVGRQQGALLCQFVLLPAVAHAAAAKTTPGPSTAPPQEPQSNISAVEPGEPSPTEQPTSNSVSTPPIPKQVLRALSGKVAQQWETQVYNYLKIGNPGNVGQNITLRVANVTRGLSTTIRPDDLVRLPETGQAPTYTLNDAKFTAPLANSLTSGNLKDVLTKNQSTVADWMSSGDQLTYTPVGQNAQNFGLQPGVPITIKGPFNIYVQGANETPTLRTYP